MVDPRTIATGDLVRRRDGHRIYEAFRVARTDNPRRTGVLLFPVDEKRRALAPSDRALRDYRRVER